MQLWQGTSEDFLIKKGWKKVKGWKIDLDALRDYDYLDVLFLPELSGYVEECEYWQGSDSHSESASNDPDDIIEHCYEDYFDENDNLWDEPVNEIKR